MSWVEKYILQCCLKEENLYVTLFVHDTSNDQWSSLQALPYIHYSLVTIADYKQLLAIGEMASKHRELRSVMKCLHEMKSIKSGLLHTLICLLHCTVVQVYP